MTQLRLLCHIALLIFLIFIVGQRNSLISNTSVIRVQNSMNRTSFSSTTPSRAAFLLSHGDQPIYSANAVQRFNENRMYQTEAEKGPEEFRSAVISDPLHNSSELFAEADISSDDEQNSAEPFCDSEPTLAFFNRFSSSNRFRQSEQQLRLRLVRGLRGTVHFSVQSGDRDEETVQEYRPPSYHWLCEYCLGAFSVHLPRVSHLARFHHSADGKLIYYCYKCKRRGKTEETYFGNEDQFRTHLAIKHGITIVKEADNDGQPVGGKIENDGQVAPWNCQSTGTSKDIIDLEASNSETPSSARAEVVNGGDHGYASFSSVLKLLEKKHDTYEPSATITCKYCLGSFTRNVGLRKHQQRFHYLDQKEPRYFCSICSGKRNPYPIYFSSKKEFQRHAKEKHGYAIGNDKSDTNQQSSSNASSTSVDSDNSSTSAPARGTATSGKIPSTNKGKQSKELKPKYVCRYCLGIFGNTKYLEKHQRDFHYVANGNVTYYCSMCTGAIVRYRLYFQNEEAFRTHIAEKHGIIDAGNVSSEVAAAIARVQKEKAIKKFPRKLEAGDQKNDDFKKMKVDDRGKPAYSGDFGMSAASGPRNCGKSGVPDSEMGASAWTTRVKAEPVESKTADIGIESVLPDSVAMKIEPIDAS